MLVDYLQKEVIVFRLYGFADFKPKAEKKQSRKPVQRKPIQANISGNNDSTDISMDSSVGSIGGAGRTQNAVTV